MARPCTVCVHPKRAEIDQRLAFQVVNVKQLAADMGLGRDAVRSHRAKHLPAFLPAFQARADALTLDRLQAEAQRLYLVALDALAQAERGVLVEITDDGTAHYRVSSTAVARLIREARTSLGLLASLAVDGETPVESPKANDQLDSRIAAALDRALAQVGSSNVVDAVLVDDVDAAPRVAAPQALGAPTLGPGAGSRPRPAADEYPLDAETPPGGSGEKGTHAADEAARVAALDRLLAEGQQVHRRTLDRLAADDWDTRRASLTLEAARRGVTISPGASREELKAMGFDVDNDLARDA